MVGIIASIEESETGWSHAIGTLQSFIRMFLASTNSNLNCRAKRLIETSHGAFQRPDHRVERPAAGTYHNIA